MCFLYTFLSNFLLCKVKSIAFSYFRLYGKEIFSIHTIYWLQNITDRRFSWLPRYPQSKHGIEVSQMHRNLPWRCLECEEKRRPVWRLSSVGYLEHMRDRIFRFYCWCNCTFGWSAVCGVFKNIFKIFKQYWEKKTRLGCRVLGCLRSL